MSRPYVAATHKADHGHPCRFGGQDWSEGVVIDDRGCSFERAAQLFAERYASPQRAGDMWDVRVLMFGAYGGPPVELEYNVHAEPVLTFRARRREHDEAYRDALVRYLDSAGDFE